jgi:hypothetical protein
VKKNKLKEEIATQFRLLQSGEWKGQETLFTIFTRLHAKTRDEIKCRLFFAPSHTLTIVETWLGASLSEFLCAQHESTLYVGKTQRDISKLVQQFKPYYVYSFDYSSFDQRLPLSVLRLVSTSMEVLFPPRVVKYWRYVCDQLIFGRYWHPTTGVIVRQRGLPSGSYFTNIIGGLCNCFILWYAIFRTKQASAIHRIIVHGDDSIVATTRPLDVSMLTAEIAKLGMIIKHDEEGSSVPGVDKVHFLGSLWKDGLPYRDWQVLLTTCATLRAKLEPIGSMKDLIEARVYSICGYTADLTTLWSRLALRSYVGRKIFVFSNQLDWERSLQARRTGEIGSWVTGSAEPWFER